MPLDDIVLAAREKLDAEKAWRSAKVLKKTIAGTEGRRLFLIGRLRLTVSQK